MSIDDFLTKPNPDLYSGRATKPTFTVGRGLLFALVALVLSPFFIVPVLFVVLIIIGLEDSGSTDGPAPDGDYATRRAWGEEKLQHHFKAAEKWIRNSSQIAKDVGSIKGVAPIGSPNRFNSYFGESDADMNLQVVGDKGEGVLRLPDFCADDPRYAPSGFHRASWRFENRTYRVHENGKSQLERLGVDSLFDQIFEFAEKEDHASVVMTCRMLDQATKNHEHPSSVFWSLGAADRFKLLTQYADSLAETSNDALSKAESTNMYAQAAALKLKQLVEQQDYTAALARPAFKRSSIASTKPKQDQIRLNLEKINALLQKAQTLEPNNEGVLKLASWRTLFAYQNQCGTMLFKSLDEDLDSDKRQQLIRRELKGMFKYAEQLAKRSPYLRSELGTITTSPLLGYTGVPKATRIHWSNMPIELTEAIGNNNCEGYCTLRVNPDGRYQSYIGIAIEGANGKTGRLTVFVQESNSPESRLDLFNETPRGPSGSNFTASIIRWAEDGKRYVSLSPDTLNRKKKKSRSN